MDSLDLPPMHDSSRPIRILLLETNLSLSTPVVNILHARSLLNVFDLVVVSTLSEIFSEVAKEAPDMVLMDVDPVNDPEMSSLARLHQAVPHLLILTLLSDEHQGLALSTLEHGAHGFLLASQVNQEALPVILLRSMERHINQKALRESEERLRLLIEHASDVILMLDKSGVISYSGPSTERILHYSESELTGKNALDFIHRDDRLAFLVSFEKAFETNQSLPLIPFRFRLPDGNWRTLEGQGRIAPDSGGRPMCILNSHDITHRVKLEEDLRSLSLRDELTGLHNRRSFTTCLEQQLKVAKRSKLKGIYLLFIDLDGFKKINDNFGHNEGDHALVEAARLLKATFRDADLVARLGGDEFAIFLSDDFAGANIEILKRRLQESVEEWNRGANRPYQLAMSVGVVHHDLSERRSVTDLLREADDLMYKQKREKKRIAGHPVSLPHHDVLPLSVAGSLSADSQKN